VAILNETPFPVLSEEGKHMDYAVRRGWDTLWIVDPLVYRHVNNTHYRYSVLHQSYIYRKFSVTLDELLRSSRILK